MIQERGIFERDTPLSPALGAQFTVLACDHYHHFYHYQSSAQYLWLAETLSTLEDGEAALVAYSKAIFQDHFNEDALKGKHRLNDGEPRSAHIPHYDKHTAFDLAFCASIGELPTDATAPHDDGMKLLQQLNLRDAHIQFEEALRADPLHSNSHFALGQACFMAGHYEQASASFHEAIRLSHLKHDSYHRLASAEHVERGRQFLHGGGLDLAIADFSKALDLYPRSKDALQARANCYRLKGNGALAQADERAAKAFR